MNCDKIIVTILLLFKMNCDVKEDTSKEDNQNSTKQNYPELNLALLATACSYILVVWYVKAIRKMYRAIQG